MTSQNSSHTLKALNFSDHIQDLKKDFTGRFWFFSALDKWLQGSEQYFILLGEPGIGKSTIAAQLISRSTLSIAYHFCIAGRHSTISPQTILRSIAAQLGKIIPEYGEALASTIDPIHLSINVNINVEKMTSGQITGVIINHLYVSDPLKELEILIRAPLEKLGSRSQVLIILIDALDEAVAYDEENNFVRLIANLKKDVPSWVRFLFTSRPERRVLRYFHDHHPFILSAEGQENLNDIKEYIAKRIQGRSILLILGTNKIDQQDFIQKVTELSEGNFLYTKILLDDVESGQQPLQDLQSLPRGLDATFHQFLTRFSVQEWERYYQLILTVLAVAKEPISEEQIFHFTRINKSNIRQKLGVLRQYLQTENNEFGQESFVLFHRSFREYLLDQQRNTDFWCAPDDGHASITKYYFTNNGSSWESCDRYGMFYLPKHLSESKQTAVLKKLLVDYEWLQTKLEVCNVTLLLSDFKLFKGPYFKKWQSFFEKNSHILRRGNEAWPARRILFQLAIEHAESSPLTQTVEEWLKKGKCDWLFLRKATRPLTIAIDPCIKILTGHRKGAVNNGIFGVKELSNGKILSWASDGTFRKWDIQSGEELNCFQAHQGIISPPIFLLNNFVCSWSEGELVRIWNLETFETIAIIDFPSIEDAMFLENGKLLLWSAYGGIWCTDIHASEIQHVFAWNQDTEINPRRLKGLLQLSSSTLCMWFDDGGLQLLDLNSGIVVKTLEGHSDAISNSKWDPPIIVGDFLITSSYDGTAKLWDAQTGKLINSFQVRTRAMNGFSPTYSILLSNNKLLAWTFENCMRVWDISNGDLLQTLYGYNPEGQSTEKGRIDNVLELPNDKFVSFTANHVLQIWNSNTLELITTITDTYQEFVSMQNAKLLDHGFLVSWTSNRIYLWDYNKGCLLLSFGHSGGITGVIPLTTGGLLSWSQDNTLRVWNDKIRSSENTHTEIEDEIVGSLEMTDNRILSWSSSGFFRIWHSTQDNPLLTVTGHNGLISGVEKLPSRNQILSWSKDKSIKLWDSSSFECLAAFIGHESAVEGIKVLQDDKILSWAADSVIKIWEKDSGECIATFNDHLSGVHAGGFLPFQIEGVLELYDGQVLSWSRDTTLRLWDHTGKVIRIFAEHSDTVNGCRLVKNDVLLSWSRDATVCVWNLLSGQLIGKLIGHVDSIDGLIVLTDNNFLSWSSDAILKIWDQTSLQCLHTLGRKNSQNKKFEDILHTVFLLPDSKIYTEYWDEMCCIWNATTGQMVEALSKNDVQQVHPDWLSAHPHSRSRGHFLIHPTGSGVSLSDLKHPGFLSVWNCDDPVDVLAILDDSSIAINYNKKKVLFLKTFWKGCAISFDQLTNLLHKGKLTHYRLTTNKTYRITEFQEHDFSSSVYSDDRGKRFYDVSDFSQAFQERGEMLQADGKFEKAIENYNQALRLHPSALAYLCRARAYYSLEDYEKAINDFSSSIDLSPIGLNYYDRATTYHTIGEIRSALHDINMAISIDGDFANKHNLFAYRARFQQELYNHKEAIIDWGIAINLSPRNAEFYYNRALCKSALGDEAGSLQDRQISYSLDPALRL